MRKIIEIIWVENRINANSEPYKRTHVRLDDGEIYVGYGHAFKVGNLVEAFYDAKWDTLKIQLPKKLKDT